MPSDQTRNIVQHFLQFLTQRNLEELIMLFSDNTDWFIPGNTEIAPWLGKRNSRSKIKEFYQLLWNNTEPVSAQIDKIFIDDKEAVIVGDFSTKMLRTNNVVNSPFSIHLTVENNLIVRYRLLEDSYAVHIALTYSKES